MPPITLPTRTAKAPLTRAAQLSQHAGRNEGAISFILDKVRHDILEAIAKSQFHGRLVFGVDIVDQDVMHFDDSHGQKFKLK